MGLVVEVLLGVLVEVLELELLGEGRLGRGMGLAGRTRARPARDTRVRASSDREGRDPNEIHPGGIEILE